MRVHRLALFMAMVLLAGIAARAATLPTLRVGYGPIINCAQLFVVEHEGWAKEAGLRTQLTRVAHPPALVEAAAGGQLDVLYAGSALFAQAIARGQPLRIVAACDTGGIALGAHAEFAAQARRVGIRRTLLEFPKTHGRKPIVFPSNAGGIPEALFLYWLERVMQLPREAVDIHNVNPEQMPGVLLAGAGDLFTLNEPHQSILELKGMPFEVLQSAQEFFPAGPVPIGVIAVREAFLKEHPDLMRRWLALHAHATELLRQNAPAALAACDHVLGRGLLSTPVLTRALEHMHARYSSALTPQMRTALTTLTDFMAAAGYYPRAPGEQELFADVAER